MFIVFRGSSSSLYRSCCILFLSSVFRFTHSSTSVCLISTHFSISISTRPNSTHAFIFFTLLSTCCRPPPTPLPPAPYSPTHTHRCCHFRPFLIVRSLAPIRVFSHFVSPPSLLPFFIHFCVSLIPRRFVVINSPLSHLAVVSVINTALPSFSYYPSLVFLFFSFSSPFIMYGTSYFSRRCAQSHQ